MTTRQAKREANPQAGHREGRQGAPHRRDFRAFRGGRSPSKGRACPHQSLHASGRRRAFGAGDRCGVNKATAALFAIADTPSKMLALGEERLRDHIKTIGLFRAKAKNVIALSKLLIERHGGAVPRRPRGARGAAGRWPQDRQCRAQHRLWRAGDRRRHPYFSGLQSPAAGPRQVGRGGRDRAWRSSCRTASSFTRITG